MLAVLKAVQTFRDHLWSLRVALFLRQHDSNILPEEGSGNSRGVRVPIDNVKATICSRVSGCGGARLESGEPGSWIRMDTMSSGVFGGAKRWLVNMDLFATNLNNRLPLFFSLVLDPMAIGVDAMLQVWKGMESYAFPPLTVIFQVLQKLCQSLNCQLTLLAPVWPQRPWFADLLELLLDVPMILPMWVDLLRQPHLNRLHKNLSPAVAEQLAHCRRKSIRLIYQAKWAWCRSKGHSISRPTLPKSV